MTKNQIDSNKDIRLVKERDIKLEKASKNRYHWLTYRFITAWYFMSFDTLALSVSQLNRKVKTLLETSFKPLWIVGEISNFSCPYSGHWYFSLKDESAQVRCAMFRGRNNNIKFLPEDGMQVLVYAKISLYGNRGDYQLIIEHIEERGAGALQRAFVQLKKKLASQGLFDKQHKKAIPDLPKCLGVITSATGAAIHDVVRVLRRRYPLLSVIIYPTPVQGDKAAETIVNKLMLANQRQECDVLLLTRGGGSLEDLQAFNEENVAQAIFASQIPIISAVGHEVDFTMSDFVADHRAATPSAAAEYVSPDIKELTQHIDHYLKIFQHCIKNLLEQTKQSLQHLNQRLIQRHPSTQLEHQRERLKNLTQHLILAEQHIIHQKQTQFEALSLALNTVSPLATLRRGYAIVRKTSIHADQKRIVDNSAVIKSNETLNVKLGKGDFDCIVTEIHNEG